MFKKESLFLKDRPGSPVLIGRNHESVSRQRFAPVHGVKRAAASVLPSTPASRLTMHVIRDFSLHQVNNPKPKDNIWQKKSPLNNPSTSAWTTTSSSIGCTIHYDTRFVKTRPTTPLNGVLPNTRWR